MSGRLKVASGKCESEWEDMRLRRYFPCKVQAQVVYAGHGAKERRLVHSAYIASGAVGLASELPHAIAAV